MKVMERVLESIIKTQVDIDSVQFGFMPARGTTDAIFILRRFTSSSLTLRKLLIVFPERFGGGQCEKLTQYSKPLEPSKYLCGVYGKGSATYGYIQILNIEAAKVK